MTILQFRQRCAAVRFFLVNIAAGCSKTSSPAGIAVKLRCSVVHKIGLPPAVSQPASISSPQFGHFTRKHILSEKQKTLCLLSKRQSVPKHSAVPLFLPPPRGTRPLMPAVTGRCFIGHHTSTPTRVVFQQEAPRGYSPQPLAAFHQTAALFAGGLPATRPDPRRNIPFTALSYHISAVCQGGFRKNPREKYPLTDSGTAGRCSGRCRPGTAPG